MSEMIERVARAICRLRFYEGGLTPIEQLIDESWPQHVEQVRVAIAAMRVPTEPMMNVTGHPVHAKYDWMAMIDEALK